jgi:RNA polymerase sigma factor (sigma-70 family)
MIQPKMENTMIRPVLSLVPTKKRPMTPNKPDSEMDEYELFQRIVDGDSSAFEVFYKLYYLKLFRFIQRMTHQPELVEELIQETLLVVWEKPERFNHTSKISTWVFGIAYNKALKSLSMNARRHNDVDVDDLVETIGDPTANLAEKLESEDWLSCSLATLSPDQRAVIELTFYHELPYQEIAKILNCPENTVKTRMFHARKKLQLLSKTQED